MSFNRWIPCVVLLAAAAAAELSAQGVYFPQTGRRYAATPLPGNIASLRSQAAAMGGKLASIHSYAEMDFIIQNVFPTFVGGDAFIGLSDEASEGVHVWDDGSPVDYLPWGWTQPDDFNGNQDNVRLLPWGELDDIEGNYQAYGIVEGKVLSPAAQVVFFEDFSDNNAGWTLGTEWQIGAAAASGPGDFGYPDPSLDADGVPGGGVAGVQIGGLATTPATHGFYWLTSPTIPTTSSPEPTLTFLRFLNTDYLPYMNSAVEVFNGTSWIRIWENGLNLVTDMAWKPVSFNVAAHAGPSFKVRFGFMIGSTGVYNVSSWNLDNLSVTTGGPKPTLGMYAPLGAGSGSLGFANVACPPNSVAITAVTIGNGNVPNGWFFGLQIPTFDLIAQINTGGPPFIVFLDGMGRSEFEFLGGVPAGLPLAAVTVPIVGGFPSGWTPAVTFVTQ